MVEGSERMEKRGGGKGEKTRLWEEREEEREGGDESVNKTTVKTLSRPWG